MLLPSNFNLVSCKWDFKTKYGNNIAILNWKAYLVIEGFSQQASVDYDDTYSFILKTSSMWVFLAYMTHFNLDIHQMDVQSTFLNGELKEKYLWNYFKGYKCLRIPILYANWINPYMD
jgi:hypothetical protein